MATQTIARSKTGRWRFTIVAASITVIAALIVTLVIAGALALKSAQVIPGPPELGPNANYGTQLREGFPVGSTLSYGTTWLREGGPLGLNNEYGIRPVPNAVPLGLSDDYGTRHMPEAVPLDLNDDYGTRHAGEW